MRKMRRSKHDNMCVFTACQSARYTPLHLRSNTHRCRPLLRFDASKYMTSSDRPLQSAAAAADTTTTIDTTTIDTIDTTTTTTDTTTTTTNDVLAEHIVERVLVLTIGTDKNIALDHAFPPLLDKEQQSETLQIPTEWEALPAFLLQQCIMISIRLVYPFLLIFTVEQQLTVIMTKSFQTLSYPV
jgi:hypothetical protein